MTTEADQAKVALQMENRLLTIEVEYLRGRNADLERRMEAPRSESGDGAGSAAQVAALREQVAELRKARSDLRWLLERLGGSPAGPLLRRFDGFRTLEERWVS